MSEEKATNGTAVPAVKVEKPKFSWLQPHPMFVILLVGPEERPFGIQKDFLCDHSEYYRNYFTEKPGEDVIEHIVKLPDTSHQVFGLAQHYFYTGDIISDTKAIPSYEDLVGLWNLGHKLGVEGLCERTLDAMAECRRLTERIPATPLLIQVWRDTPEGSSIRVLLLSWAAEYMRSSDARAEFAKSLPQEVLSELVVTMSSFDSAPTVQVLPPPPPPPPPAAAGASATTGASGAIDALLTDSPATVPQKNVHYLEQPSDEETQKEAKRNKRVSITGTGKSSSDPSLSRKASRSSLSKAPKRRSSAAYLDSRSFTTAQKLDFCADLLARMLSGPGFWTRLVGPFREPVEPVEDGVPDYFDKVKRPMDLSTVKAKMDNREYASDEEFLVDVRQIFENCFLYWKKGDPMWLAGEKLQRTFEDKFSGMNKWISKLGGDEE